MKSLSFLLPGVVARPTRSRGRGVFATTAIAADTVIEIAPVVVMGPQDRVYLDQTLLHDYIFEWGEDHKQVCMALGLVPLYNHAYRSNCEYEMHFKKQTIHIRTVRAIEAGEELFINYNGSWDDDKPVWFDVNE